MSQPANRHVLTAAPMMYVCFKQGQSAEEVANALDELTRKGYVIPCRSHEGCVILPRGI